MPIFILALVVIGYFIWANWGRAKARSELSRKLDPMWERMRAPKKCRWVASQQHGQGLREFTCETCGVTAYSGNPNGPKECKKGIGSGTL
jgi:hypothetical protein